jgi:hypothetical protein
MTSAEIMEQIKNKKATLEGYKSSNPPADPALVKSLEDEIKQLETSLPSDQPNPRRSRRRSAFLDDCR